MIIVINILLIIIIAPQGVSFLAMHGDIWPKRNALFHTRLIRSEISFIYL